MKCPFFTLLISFLFLTTELFGQGLTAEKSFNANYHQELQQVMVDDTISYLVYQQFYSGEYPAPSILNKIDGDGNILFETVIAPVFGERLVDVNLIPTTDGGVYVAGTSFLHCDIPEPTAFVQKYDAFGNVIWTKTFTFTEEAGWNFKLKGFSLVEQPGVSEKLMFSLSYPDYVSPYSYIYTLTTDGIVEDSVMVENNLYENFEQLDDIHFFTSKNNSLFAFNFDGVLANTRSFNEPIVDLNSINDTLIVLTEDSLLYLTNDFEIINGIAAEAPEIFKNMRLYDSNLYVQSSTLSEQHIYEFEYDLSLSSTTTIPVELPENHLSHFSKKQFSVGVPFDLTRERAVRYLSFSLSSPTDIVLNRTDAGIAGIEVLDSHYIEGYLNVNLNSKVLLTNYGPNILNSCRINHYAHNGVVCKKFYYTKVFSDLNLAPGESTWLELGWTGYKPELDPFGDPDEPDFNYCFYTSHVNELCDLNVGNDRYCLDLTDELSLNDKGQQKELQVYPNPFESTIYFKNLPLTQTNFIIYDVLGNKVQQGEVFNGQINTEELPSGTFMLQLIVGNSTVLNELIVKQ